MLMQNTEPHGAVHPVVFSVGERERRLAAVREGMAQEGLDAVLAFSLADAPGAVSWLTGYEPVFEFGWCVVTEESCDLVAGAFEWTHTHGRAWLDPAHVHHARDGLAEAERLLGGRARVGLANADWLPGMFSRHLRPFDDGSRYRPTALLDRLRAIKSDEEVVVMRRAAAITDAGTIAFQAGMAEGGMTEIELASSIEQAMRAAGLERFWFPVVLGTGPGSLDPTVMPTPRIVAPGDVAMLDCACRHDGYCADMARGAIHGEPSDEQRRMMDAVARMYEAAFERLRVGERTEAPHDAAVAVCTEAGYDYVHDTGHGIGCDVHEGPIIDAGVPEAVFEAGMVVAVEPGVYLEGLGGVRIENTILITEAGPVSLHDAPLTTW